VTRDDDHGNARVIARQRNLNIEAVHFRHVEIEHDARRFMVIDGLEKVGCASERLHCESHGRDEARQCDAHVCIVVYDRKQRRLPLWHCRTVRASHED
jgi:hypothetical protein